MMNTVRFMSSDYLVNSPARYLTIYLSIYLLIEKELEGKEKKKGGKYMYVQSCLFFHFYNQEKKNEEEGRKRKEIEKY